LHYMQTGMLPQALLQLQEQLHQQPSAATAWPVLQEYFACYNQQDIRHELELMLVGSLTNDEMHQLKQGKERHNLFFFYAFTLLFMDAVQVLGNSERKLKGNTINKTGSSEV